MAKTKINPNATRLIDQAFVDMPLQWREICETLRGLIHEADPEIVEDWKWGANFNRNGMVCNVWSFKKHATIVFFRGSQMKDPYKLFNQGETNKAMRAIQFTDIKQINHKQIIAYVREAVKINLSGLENPMKMDKTVALPPELETFFAKHKKAKAVFDAMSYSHRRALVESVITAKRPETKKKRLDYVKERLKGGS